MYRLGLGILVGLLIGAAGVLLAQQGPPTNLELAGVVGNMGHQALVTNYVGGAIPSAWGTAPGISGGGALATGSTSVAGTVTSAAASGNVLTPGFTCPNKVICVLADETTAGGARVTASNTTTCTFSNTASDTVDYWASCR